MIYSNIKKKKDQDVEIDQPLIINYHFCNGAFLEILGGNKYQEYKVEFINKPSNTILYTTNIQSGNWTRCKFQYYVEWQIRVSANGLVLKTLDLNLKGERVLISMDSKSLGDTLGWMPYAEEFRKEHDCKVVLSTFKNFLFEGKYPEIEFVEPGSGVGDIYAQYNIGWYYDGENIDKYRNPKDPKMYPMQQTASDILGLKYKEIKPLIVYKDEPIQDNTITIAIHSTAQAKYWNNPTGWQEVVDYINSIGYKAIIVSSEEDGYMGNYYPTGAIQIVDKSLSSTIEEIRKSTLFIGVGTGLSWLAWTCDRPVILISGFSDEYTEFDCYRISQKNKEVCRGCFNRFKLDAGDWNWCPLESDFQCSKLIKSQEVIDAIEHYLK